MIQSQNLCLTLAFGSQRARGSRRGVSGLAGLVLGLPKACAAKPDASASRLRRVQASHYWTSVWTSVFFCLFFAWTSVRNNLVDRIWRVLARSQGHHWLQHEWIRPCRRVAQVPLTKEKPPKKSPARQRVWMLGREWRVGSPA